MLILGIKRLQVVGLRPPSSKFPLRVRVGVSNLPIHSTEQFRRITEAAASEASLASAM